MEKLAAVMAPVNTTTTHHIVPASFLARSRRFPSVFNATQSAPWRVSVQNAATPARIVNQSKAEERRNRPCQSELREPRFQEQLRRRWRAEHWLRQTPHPRTGPRFGY